MSYRKYISWCNGHLQLTAAVELPTLCGLTELIRKTYSDPFKEIERILNQNSDTISYLAEELDLEIFLTILDSMVDPPKAIYELGPLAVYLYKLIERKNSIDGIVKSEKEIRDLKNNSVPLMNEVLRHPDRSDKMIPMEIATHTLVRNRIITGAAPFVGYFGLLPRRSDTFDADH